jgi:integrase/recombinase XerD
VRCCDECARSHRRNVLHRARLLHQLQASPRTVAAYRDTLRLLLGFAAKHTGKPPSGLDFDDLDADLIAAFLTYLEQHRHNSIRTRNARLAAIRSLFRFAALRHPEHAGLIQRVLAIPAKRHERRTVSYLTTEEIDALPRAPDRSSWHGRRDHALLVLAVQTGLRVSELTALTLADVELGSGAYVRVHGLSRVRDKPCYAERPLMPSGPRAVSICLAGVADRGC